MPNNSKFPIHNSKPKKAYAAAGVDVDLGNRVKSGISRGLGCTPGPEVLGRIAS